MKLPQIDILGVNVTSLTMQQAIAAAEKYMRSDKAALIATANAEMLMNSVRDKELKNILNTADLVVPDGAGTVWAARHLGCNMPERVAGYDLVQELLRRSPKNNFRIFFFGAAPGVAEAAKRKAEQLYPGVQIVGCRNGFFSEADEPEIVQQIKAARPHLLLAALGVPKQEKWLYNNLEHLQVPLSIGVGGTFDVMAGVMKRAPLWMQKAKLEWLFRGLMQPKRAMRLLALPQFVIKVLSYKK